MNDRLDALTSRHLLIIIPSKTVTSEHSLICSSNHCVNYLVYHYPLGTGDLETKQKKCREGGYLRFTGFAGGTEKL